MKKKIILPLFICILLLSSCQRYFKIEFNRYTKIYLPGTTVSTVTDCYDLYRNKEMPAFRSGNRTYFFEALQYYNFGKISPPLAFVVDGSTEINYVCTNENCVHNNMFEFTERCILCDIPDYSKVAVSKGMLYFVRAKRSDGLGGFYYEHTDGTDYSDASAEVFFGMEMQLAQNDTEVPWELIQYDLESGEYYVLYDVDPGSYLDSTFISGENVYFIETYYIERKNVIYTGNDGNYMYFTDHNNNEKVVKRTERHFFTELTLRAEKIRYFQTLPDPPYYTSVHMVNFRDHRKYKVGDDGTLWEKVYALKRINLKTSECTTLTAELESVPKEIFACDGRIYRIDERGIISSDLDCKNEVTLFDYKSFDLSYDSISYLQYDQYTKQLYFLGNNTLYRTITYDDRGITVLISHFEGAVFGYQLTADGFYLTVGKNTEVEVAAPNGHTVKETDYSESFVFVRWIDIHTPEHTVIYSDENDVKLYSPTVIGDYIYGYAKRSSEYWYYYMYKIKMTVTVTEQKDVDKDTPGAGITGYKVETKLSALKGSKGAAEAAAK